MLPNFLLIGAQKAGTTALSYYLSQHPQVYMSPVKEPGFFAFEEQSPNFSGPNDYQSFRFVTTDLNEYQQLFAAVGSEKAIGEASTWYLYHPDAPNRIRHYIPDVKLIAVLRNPVDRAFSSYMHLVKQGREPLASFKDALAQEEKRINAGWEYLWHYKQMGLYANQIKRYQKRFKYSQLKIFLYEDLDIYPEKVLREIFSFLEIENEFVPPVLSRHNISGIKKSKFVDNLLRNDNPLKSALKPLLPIKFRQELADFVRVRNYKRYTCPKDVRAQLIKEFRNDIIELQDLIQQDLTGWLTLN